MSVKVDIKVSVDEYQEIRQLLGARKTQLEAWILAKAVSEEEREEFRKELAIVQNLRGIFT